MVRCLHLGRGGTVCLYTVPFRVSLPEQSGWPILDMLTGLGPQSHRCGRPQTWGDRR